MSEYPRVVLFGSIKGGWREKYAIPVLDALGVSYYHPGPPGQVWTEEMGQREAEALRHCETIVMVVNNTSPAFGGLGETGWAALGAAKRHQTFLLYVQPDYTWQGPDWMRMLPGVKALVAEIEEYALRTRSLVTRHAKQFADEMERLIVVDSLDALAAQLKRLYSEKE